MPRKSRGFLGRLFNWGQQNEQTKGENVANQGERRQNLTSNLPKTTARNNTVSLPESSQKPLPETTDDFVVSRVGKADLSTKGKFSFTKEGRTIPTDPELREIYDRLTGTLDADTDIG